MRATEHVANDPTITIMLLMALLGSWAWISLARESLDIFDEVYRFMRGRGNLDVSKRLRPPGVCELAGMIAAGP